MRRKQSTIDMTQENEKVEKARVLAAEAHASATAENASLLRTKDAKISELRKRLSDQRIEYEDILSEQKDILLQNENAMNELSDLHTQEVLELTEQITTTRNGSQAVNEAHTLDVQRLQSEITTLRNDSNHASEEVLGLTTELQTSQLNVETVTEKSEELQEELIQLKKVIEDQKVKTLEMEKNTKNSVIDNKKKSDEMKNQTLILKKSESKNGVLQRAKAALSDEIRKLVK